MFGNFQQLRMGTLTTCAGQDRYAFCFLQDRSRSRQVLTWWQQCRVVAEKSKSRSRKGTVFVRDVAGQNNDCYAPLRYCRAHGYGKNPGHLVRLGDHATIVATVLEYLLRICLLKICCSQFGTGNLRGNREHWNATAMTVEQTIDEVQVTGATASGNDRQPIGKVSICPSRKSGRLFMAHMNPLNSFVLTDGVGEPVQ